jgi:hypothetical protein
VIRGVPVVVTNIETNVTSTARTNEGGFCLFSGLLPGSYRLTATVPGMEKYEGAFTVQVATRCWSWARPLPRWNERNAHSEHGQSHHEQHAGACARIEQLPINQRMLNTLILTQLERVTSTADIG